MEHTIKLYCPRGENSFSQHSAPQTYQHVQQQHQESTDNTTTHRNYPAAWQQELLQQGLLLRAAALVVGIRRFPEGALLHLTVLYQCLVLFGRKPSHLGTDAKEKASAVDSKGPGLAKGHMTKCQCFNSWDENRFTAIFSLYAICKVPTDRKRSEMVRGSWRPR